MVANGTVCAGCCYIAIFRFPAPFLLSSSRNIRHLHYDGTMSCPRICPTRSFAAVRKRYEKDWAGAFCVITVTRTSKLTCLATLDATVLAWSWPEPWTPRSLGCENHRRILFHG